MIGILTATYNRENQLQNLYNSLLKNHNEFIWYIMDDGSTDNTEHLINSFIKENKIKIIYKKQNNMGKMTAINNLIEFVTTPYIIEVDSDDALTENAILTMISDIKELKDQYGIIYNTSLSNNNYFSKINNQTKKLFDIHYKDGYTYDMAILFKTDIKKKFPYILIDKESFVTEASCYYLMDENYSGLLVKDSLIKVVNYQTDGYTNNIKKIFKKYPKGYLKYFTYLINKKEPILFKSRLYIIKHYLLFNILNKIKFKNSYRNISNKFNKFIYLIVYIPGVIKSKNF